MKIWFDENKQAPSECVWIKSIEGLSTFLETFERRRDRLAKLCEENPLSSVKLPEVELISIGNNENVLNWLKKTCRIYPIHIHTLSPIEVVNMKKIIKENGWCERYHEFKET